MYQSTPTKDSFAQLYKEGKSMFEISEILNCSQHKVVYWLDKYNIKRRNRSEAMYVKLNPFGDPFSIKSQLNEQEQFLYGLGIGIYWGEGDKASHNRVGVANSDPYVLLAFSEFLQKICGVKKEKMTYSLVCFNDVDPSVAKAYWSKLLQISESKFGKIVSIPKQGKGTYKKKSQFGVCTLCVSNIKLKAWIMGEMDKLKKDADIV